jgi:hypothetical protein
LGVDRSILGFTFSSEINGVYTGCKGATSPKIVRLKKYIQEAGVTGESADHGSTRKV